MASEIEQRSIEKGDNDTFTCERCSHFEVCFLRKNISEFMGLHFPGGRPFEVPELAKICSMYDPIMRLTFEK